MPLALELELSTFRTRERRSICEDIDTMLTSAYRSSVLNVENLNIIINSVPRRVNILIMCKLTTLII